MKEFKSYPKAEKKPKLSKQEMWNNIKKRSLEKMKANSMQFTDKDTQFYNEIWKERLHQCEKCNQPLGSTWNKWNFHHIKLKSKFPLLRYEKDNIMLICLMCHSNEHT